MLSSLFQTRSFDGVICFGGQDWWYHNRGHYDMQMMKRLSAHVPVLYVNSLGMRTPSPVEGRMFLTRIRRKLASLRRGLVDVGESLSVFSPPFAPGRLGTTLSRPLLTAAVRRAAQRCGIRKPLVWVACPTAAEALDGLDPQAIVYQRTDRYESFKGVDAARIIGYDEWLKARADLTVFCSRLLHEAEAGACQGACYVDHGVDVERFVAAGDGQRPQPQDIAGVPRPRVGFIGGIDDHTFDRQLFLDVARELPDCSFALVGACSLPAGWCDLPNVTLLGQRPYDDVASYMAACDVLIMPWNRSPWIEACNPVKLKEYLAVGRPIVSTDFAQLRTFDGAVHVAVDAPGFAAAIRSALDAPHDPGPGRDVVHGQSWESKVDAVLDELEAQGIVAAGRPRRRQPQLSETTAKHITVHTEVTVTEPVDTTANVPWPHVDIAACILLAGGLRPSPLTAAAGRSPLDLWVGPDQTVLDGWVDRIAELAAELGTVLPVRVVHDAVVPPPWPSRRAGRHVTIEQEANALRGPAGVTRDVCRAYGPDQHVLVAEGARLLGASLIPVLAEHIGHGSDITVASNPDGSPAGVYLVRCGALGLVPAVGFVDLKEQWLDLATKARLNVRVHRLPPPGAMPVRTRPQLLAAARCLAPEHGASDETTGVMDAGDAAGLRVVCPGGLIGPGATVLDSIVMPGAIVGAMAIVVRSVLCPESRVHAGAEIVDSVVCGGDALSDYALSAITL